MNFQESDFISIDDFSLIWRWTQESHKVLPKTVLNSIKPLSLSLSSKLYSIGLNNYSKLEESSPSVFEASYKNQKSVRETLVSLTKNEIEEIYIVWDNETAVITTWKSFVNYWDDFCYPSSDDVFVFPSSNSWILAYRHFEQFEFLNLSSGAN
tara:strand:- start:3 stop:461 length:459 start_codon:yes stop_codon:yes gene_type:complete